MSNIAILCSGGDDISRQEKMSDLIFLVSKISLIETSPHLLTFTNPFSRKTSCQI